MKADTTMQNVADRIADAIGAAARHLGTQDAATRMGAIECLAMEVREGSARIADALVAIADAIAERKD